MTKQKFDPYRELDVPRDASPEEIKAAGRRRAKATHPDAGGNAKAFAATTRALTILRDPEKRRRFDETGDEEAVDADNADAGPLTAIAQLVRNMLTGAEEPPMNADLLDAIRQGLRATIMEIQQRRAPAVRAEARAKRLLKRFKRKSKGEGNLFQAIITAELAQHVQARLKWDDEIKRMQRAMELLDDYEFEQDKPNERLAVMMSSMFSTTSTA